MNEAFDLWMELREGSALDSDKHIKAIEESFKRVHTNLISNHDKLIKELEFLKKGMKVLSVYIRRLNSFCPSCGVGNLEIHKKNCELASFLSPKYWKHINED